MEKEPTCYGRVGTGTWTQETYETVSRDARRRAQQLRKLGFKVCCSALGMQVTPVGLVKMTMVDVRHPDGNPPPWPTKYERL